MKKKLLITVKTYPYPHPDYQETVCTAGVDEEGNWHRLFPIRYRALPFKDQYKKWDWVELDVKKNPNDFRPESHHLIDMDSEIKIVGHVSSKEWDARKALVLKHVYIDMQSLISEAKDETNLKSLAVFKPRSIRVFHQTDSAEWTESELERMKQMDIFADNQTTPLRKLPYSFGYEVTDENNYTAKLRILDWEIGMLYWNCLTQEQGNADQAVKKVIDKLENLSKTQDLYLFLGTTQQFHRIAPNPFTIIGLFYPPHDPQLTIF